VGLEIIEGIVILGTFMTATIAAIYYKSTLSGVKKAKKRNEISVYENLTQYREVEKGTISDILKQKDNQIKSLNARIKALEPIDEEEPEAAGISFEEIQVIVKQVSPKYAGMLPLLKDQVMEITKGMTKQEVLQYVGQLTGNQQSSGQVGAESVTYNKDWA